MSEKTKKGFKMPSSFSVLLIIIAIMAVLTWIIPAGQYKVCLLYTSSRRLSLSFLKQAMMTFIETDYAIKSGTYEKDYLFDLALLKVANSV